MSSKEIPVRKSVAPDPLANPGGAETRGGSRAPPDGATSWAAVIAALLDVVQDEQLLPEERAWLEELLSVQDAHRLGAKYGHDTVLQEWSRCAEALLPVLQAVSLVGYGRLRFRFAAEIAAEVARQSETQSSNLVVAAGARAGTKSGLRGTRALRREARRVLKALGGRRAEHRARLQKTAEKGEKTRTRAQSLESMAEEIKRVLKTVPARIAREAGATPEFVRALNDAAKKVVRTDAARRERAQAVQSTYNTLHVLKGRLLHELQAMLAAARDARKSDPLVPAVRTSLFKRVAARRPPPNPAPAPTPAPA